MSAPGENKLVAGGVGGGRFVGSSAPGCCSVRHAYTCCLGLRVLGWGGCVMASRARRPPSGGRTRGSAPSAPAPPCPWRPRFRSSRCHACEGQVSGTHQGVDFHHRVMSPVLSGVLSQGSGSQGVCVCEGAWGKFSLSSKADSCERLIDLICWRR